MARYDRDHWGIYGTPGHGKTTFATQLSYEYQQRGIKVIVLDKWKDERWCSDLIFGEDEKQQFRNTVLNAQCCAVFVDEAHGVTGQYDEDFHFLATEARHYGHWAHFITPRPTDIAKTVRSVCQRLALFALPGSDCKVLAEEWMDPVLAEATGLEKFHFFQTSRSGSASLRRVTPR